MLESPLDLYRLDVLQIDLFKPQQRVSTGKFLMSSCFKCAVSATVIIRTSLGDIKCEESKFIMQA